MFAGGYYTNSTSSSVDSLFEPFGVSSVSFSQSIDKIRSTADDCSGYPQLQYSCTCPSCNSSLVTNGSVFSFPDEVPPCYNGTVTGSRVQNLTLPYDPLDPDVGYYYLHNYLLRSTNSFIEQRYGGVSFGHVKDSVAASVDEINSATSTLPFLATRSAAKVWYSFKGYHAMPAYLNAMNNAILRGNLPDHSSSKVGKFKVSNFVILCHWCLFLIRYSYSLTSF